MFGNFQKRVQNWFGDLTLKGRLKIDAGKGTQPALTVNQDAGATGKLLDVQLANTPVFTVEKDGRLWANKGIGGHGYFPIQSGISFIGNNQIAFYSATLVAFQVGYDAAAGIPKVSVHTTLSFGWQDVLLWRDAAQIFAQRNALNAQESRLYATWTSDTDYQRLSTKTLKQAITAAAGASVVSTITIPKYSQLIGVTTRVTTALGVTTGTTGYSIGDGTDPDLWGTITGTAVGTTTDAANFTAINALGPASDNRTITLTATGGNFDGTGVIEVCAFYLRAEAD